MKLIGRVFFLTILLLILSPILVLGYFGFIPGLSSFFGSDKPRDLKIKYTDADFKAARSQSKVEYMELPKSTPDETSIQRVGTREVNMELTSSQATSLMNDRPWKYWPYNNVQVKFNADGSAETSGILIKDKLPGYAATIGIPKEAVAFAMKFLPVNPVFYLKMKASLKNNKIEVFEPQKFELGRIPIPVNIFLSKAPKKMFSDVYAIDIAGMTGELSQIKNKKDLIISYINGRLAGYSSFFYAREARIEENKLIYKGRLAEKELMVK
ncbi:MAG: hypothetical protein UR68_C0005G0024 [Candidatus Roizmanbacteria bacterium GW2011_GWA2_35_19]|uniref:Uncharacterized protein n=2 Tax=Candidatus Roizmaniibacteriota TaxID=1752723 RepID=A0A0G0EDG2_9BACT|nr:MAG: hypothetical protein UR63_C0005G0008 [Candidatus Roizmanbacteria bacterium GW2011_GWC2_35_12]KKP73290.1 MAG: hypothetical protein UR68_C0005G0024 [Candidatus Roizmanbacteria bacterium GW2011_GWA2_35_19]